MAIGVGFVLSAVPAGVVFAKGAQVSKYSAVVDVNATATGKTIPPGLVGVDGPLQPSEVSLMSSLGVKWARIETNFDGQDGSTPIYNCSNGVLDAIGLDKEVLNAEQAGATPEILIDYSPPCLSSTQGASPQPQYGVPDLGPNKAKWDQLVYEMAVHEMTVEGVHYFSVWNEPDTYHWQGTPAQFFALYADTTNVLQQAAKQAKQNIQIGAPDFANATGTINTPWFDQFLNYVDSNSIELDFLDWHFFANYPDSGPTPENPQGTCPVNGSLNGQPCWYNPQLSVGELSSNFAAVEAALAQHPNLHPDLWVDAWNADEGYDQRENGPFGSAFALDVLSSGLNAGISHMSFFNDMDPDATSSSSGLLDPGLTPKPVYEAMQDWHSFSLGRDAKVSVSSSRLVSGPKMTPQVSAVASSGPDGSMTILISNFVPYDPSGNYGAVGPSPEVSAISLKLTGLPVAQHSVEVRSIDYEHKNTVVSKATVSSNPVIANVDMPENAVIMLKVTQGKSLASPSVASGNSANANDVLLLGAIAGGVVYLLWVRSRNKERKR